MDWVERYVAAVKRYLPKKTADDIGNELHSLIEDKLVEAKREKGEALSEGDVLDLLKKHGHPMRVASAYRDDRVMISPPLVPIYKLALKWTFITIFAAWVVRTVVIGSGAFGLNRETLDIDFFGLGIVYFVVVTVVFVLCDRYLSRVDFFGRWNPEKLRPLETYAAPVAISETVIGLVASQIWLLILLSIRNDFSWALLAARADDPVGTAVLWLKIHVLCAITLQLVNLFQPYWTATKAAIDAVLSLGLAGVFLWIALYPEISRGALEAANKSITPEDGEKLLLLDRFVHFGAVGVMVAILAATAFSIYRAFDLRRERPQA